MDVIINFFQEYLPFISTHKYWFLFFGAVLESLNTLVLGGFLVSIGSLKFLPTFIIFIIGDIINGYMWYLVGYFAGITAVDRWVRSEDKSRKIIEKVEDYFHRYSGRAIIITKFTFSLTIATLIMAGSLKYNIRRFTLYNFVGSVGWVILTMGVGYFFGQSYRLFIDYLWNITFFLIFLGLAITLVYIIKNLAKSAFVKSLLLSDRVKIVSDMIKEKIDSILTKNNGDKN